MKKIIALLCGGLSLLAFNSNAALIDIDPGSPLVAESGPYGYGGRGVVFNAREDFTMTSFAMELSFSGSLNFAVEVYDANSGSRGALISQSNYANLLDDGNDFLTLQHNESFFSGNTYEVIMRFDDPGVVFTHYGFDNVNLDHNLGFMAGTQMLVLDGTDYDQGRYNNTWLANFQINTSGTTDVPEPVSIALLGLGLAGIGFTRKKKQDQAV